MTTTRKALLSAVIATLTTAASVVAATYTITRVTDADGCSREPSMSGSGRVVAFDSEADLVSGQNPDGNFEIFTFDRFKGFTQITHSTGLENHEPSISTNGRSIAFTSANDLVPGSNADGSDEVFLATHGTIQQLTNSSGGNSNQPAISGNGKVVAFISTADLLPGHNLDNSAELFTAQNGFIKQITDAIGGFNEAPSVSRNGDRIAFVSSLDPTGGNFDGNEEIFLFDNKTGFKQITDTTDCNNVSPAITQNGARIAFASTCDLTGNNADNSEEIFLFDRKQGFTQITDSPTPSVLFGGSFFPAIDGRGNHVAFVSTDDLTGGNPNGGGETFVWDGHTITQLTNGTNSESVERGPSLSGSGKRIAFEYNGELTPGSNPDGNGEIYTAELDPKAP